MILSKIKFQCFVALSIMVLSGCVSVKKNAFFEATGKVIDSYGNLRVISSSESVELCVKADYVSDTGVTGYSSQCSQVVTDQNGVYSIKMIMQIDDANAKKTVDIKNAKIYGRKYSSTVGAYFYFTVNVLKSNVDINGGKFEANMSVFDIN